MGKQITDRKKVLRQTDHLTTPPRLEGKAKNAGMNTVRKKKKETKNVPSLRRVSWGV
ncbi:hypothetical protein HYT05_03510 [Candidatus Kaiserbacteria bacterium]|nr:hypothetical protein [Candidatus Kaiserbacteria bacterium]